MNGTSLCLGLRTTKVACLGSILGRVIKDGQCKFVPYTVSRSRKGCRGLCFDRPYQLFLIIEGQNRNLSRGNTFFSPSIIAIISLVMLFCLLAIHHTCIVIYLSPFLSFLSFLCL